MSSSDGEEGVRYGEPLYDRCVVTVHLNLNIGEMSFFVDGRYQGVAFQFMKRVDDPEPLFPVVVLGYEGDSCTLLRPSNANSLSTEGHPLLLS